VIVDGSATASNLGLVSLAAGRYSSTPTPVTAPAAAKDPAPLNQLPD
jgi:hypothetical protein